MRSVIIPLLLILICLPIGGSGAGKAMRRVVVIGVDGMGAESVRRVDPPNMRRLMARGAWTLGARGVLPTVSAPNWASMIMGAGPAQHGVTSNEWRADKFEIEPTCRDGGGIFPTIFSILREERPNSVIGVFHDWEGFGYLFDRKAANLVIDATDPLDAVTQAGAFLRTRRPDLTFIHLDHVDHAGHNHGWNSPEYDAAVREADRLVGLVLKRLDETGLAKETVVIVTADHGGHGDRHGDMTMSNIEIPWIAAGPGIPVGEIKRPVNTYDTAATIARILGLRQPACWIGKPAI